jgi:hypothetical protein
MKESAHRTFHIAAELSDNYQKQSQINAVVVQQEKVDRVGFEPTTSAMSAVDRKKLLQILPSPL